jgi:hypothetical protein
MNVASTTSPASHSARVLQHGDGAVVRDVLDPRTWSASVTVTDSRCGSRLPIVATWVLESARPGAHRVRVRARVRLDRGRRAAIGVALAQHRVDRAALDLVVAPLISRSVGRWPARPGSRAAGSPCLQLGDRLLQLRDRRADVRQLDDVGLGTLGEGAELGERVGIAAAARQAIGERREDACRERDVARLDVDRRTVRRTRAGRAAGSTSRARAPRR